MTEENSATVHGDDSLQEFMQELAADKTVFHVDVKRIGRSSTNPGSVYFVTWRVRISKFKED